jgi:hypothetical protein
MLTLILWDGSLTEESESYKLMNKPLALEMEHFSFFRDPVGGKWRGANLPGISRER